MEITTRYLSPDEHRAGMAEAVRFYKEKHVDRVLVAYGFGCDCPGEELYQDKPLPLSQFEAFISAAEAAGFYRVGEDNFYLKDERGLSEFLFCHEADIHFKTGDSALLDEVQRLWQRLGFQRIDPATSPIP